MSETEAPQANSGQGVLELNADGAPPAPVTPPTPGDVAAKQEPQPKAPPEGEPKAALTPQQLEAELAKVRREAAGYRTKLREVEPLAKKALEAEEAKKDEVQKAVERAEAAEKREAELQTGYTRLELAAKHNIAPENIDFIGSGSREEMEERAARLGALMPSDKKAPPSDRPVEGLRPGASPEPPKPEDTSYPANWGFQPPRDS